MYNFTLNNYLHYSYNWRPFTPELAQKLKVTDQATLKVNSRATRIAGSLLQESITAAQKIYENSTHPIKLLMSGGIDSECMADSFMKAQIPFTALILEMPDKLNFHDIASAYCYCTDNFIPYEIVPFNIQKYLESKQFISDITRWKTCDIGWLL